MASDMHMIAGRHTDLMPRRMIWCSVSCVCDGCLERDISLQASRPIFFVGPIFMDEIEIGEAA
jgi:hypothetical protein